MKYIHVFLVAIFANLPLPTMSLELGKSAIEAIKLRETPVPEEFFGLVAHRSYTPEKWPNIPFGSLRLWDSYLKWMDIQAAPGKWNFDNFDNQVDLANRNGVKVIYTLGQTPEWASVASGRHAYGRGSGGMPRNIDDWRTYIEKIVSRYKGNIYGYEIWNEPKYGVNGICSGVIFFCGSPEDLVQLTSVAYREIKRVDKNAKVASPGFTDGLHGVRRLDQYLAAGGSKYVEAISFHFYELIPERIWPIVLALRVVMEKHGLGHLPIWNTEVGYLIQNQINSVKPEHTNGPFSVVFSPKDAGKRLARVMLVSASAGIEKVYWYAWDNKKMGLVGTTDGLINSAAIGYRVVQRWLVGSSISCQQNLSSGWVCDLARDGRTARIFWSESETPTLLIPGFGEKMMEDIGDSRAPINGGKTIRWDGSPVLVSEDGMPWYPKKY